MRLLVKLFLTTLLFILLFFQSSPAQLQIAIGEFKNDTKIFYLDQWQETIPNLLQTRLSQSKDLAVLERRKLKAVLEEKALALTGLTDSTNAREIGSLLEAEYIIYGSINQIDDQHRIDASIVKVSTGQTQAEKVVGPDRDHLNQMVDLLANNILFNLTGKGDYKNRIKLTHYPTKYFLAATVGLGVATFFVRQEYNKNHDDYRNNTDLEQFNELYDKANRYNKISIGLASLTGTALIGAVYCWIRNMSPREIYARNFQNKMLMPYLTININDGATAGVQIHF
jgi:TolB-like protein